MERINEEFCEEASTIAFPQGEQKPQYPDIYSVYGFTNSYEQILEELNLIFNTSFNKFVQMLKSDEYWIKTTGHKKDFIENNRSVVGQEILINKPIEEIVQEVSELKAEFEVWRRKRMENAIAKMRQMTLHSERVIHPSYAKNPALDKDKKIGMGPNYEVDLSKSVSYRCPATNKKSN